ncbi:MAG: glycosyltransferase family 9 protein [Actinomycetota bacterium]
MNILFVTSTRIGDAVLSSGLLGHLHRAHPKARIHVACGPAPAQLFKAAPGVVEVIPMIKRRRAGHWLQLWRRTVLKPWRLVVDLRGSGLSWLLPAWERRIIRSSWEPRHRVIHFAELLGLAADPPAPELWSAPADVERARVLIPDGAPVLGLGPTANWGGKQWPAERFVAAVERLTGPGGALAGARLAVFGAEAERDAVAPLLALPRVIDLVGTTSLAEAYACLGRCAFYLGNDSGLMHMAAAAGIPTLGLFGPSSEVFYGPWGAKTATVRGPRSFEDICHSPDFDHRSHACLMLDLDVDRVVAAAEALWLRTR